MSYSTSESDSTTWWRQAIEEFRARLHAGGIHLRQDIYNENTFVPVFEQYCRTKYHERGPTRLLAKLSLGDVTAFATTLDRHERLGLQHGATAVMLASLFETIDQSVRNNLSLFAVVKLLGLLHAALPNRDQQTPLVPWREIFQLYTKAILDILESFATTSASCETIEIIINQAVRDIANEYTIMSRVNRLVRSRDSGSETQLSTTSRPSENLLRPGSQNQYTTLQHDLEHLGPLGKGSPGRLVYKVRAQSTGQVFAVKQILLEHGITQQQVKNEVDIMQRLKHEHIVSFNLWNTTASACFIYMTPAADCNLKAYLVDCTDRQYPREMLEPILSWFGCLLSALKTAHRLRILHRDIKLGNILVEGRRIYLTDFGESRDFTEYDEDWTSSLAGTRAYRAPELVSGSQYSYPADIFSLGCVFSEMLSVYCCRDLDDFLRYRIVPDHEDGSAFRINLPYVRSWIQSLHEEPTLDPINHVIKKMLPENPERRIDAREARRFLQREERGLYFCGSC